MSPNPQWPRPCPRADDSVLVKMVASALTIGSGGSAGREGPTAQISAGFCSLLTRRLDLSDEDGRTAVALGIGAAEAQRLNREAAEAERARRTTESQTD